MPFAVDMKRINPNAQQHHHTRMPIPYCDDVDDSEEEEEEEEEEEISLQSTSKNSNRSLSSLHLSPFGHSNHRVAIAIDELIPTNPWSHEQVVGTTMSSSVVSTRDVQCRTTQFNRSTTAIIPTTIPSITNEFQPDHHHQSRSITPLELTQCCCVQTSRRCFSIDISFIIMVIIQCRFVSFLFLFDHFSLLVDDDICVTYMVMSIANVIFLISSRCITCCRKWSTISSSQLQKMKGYVSSIVVCCLCIELIFIGLILQDSDNNSTKRMSDSVVLEYIVYTLMIPTLLYHCHGSQLSYWLLQWFWIVSVISSSITLFVCMFSVDINTICFYIGLILISQVILVTSYHQSIIATNMHLILVQQHQHQQTASMLLIEELKQQNQTLSKQLAIKQEEVISQRYLLANAAHDLKTPVAATISGCELMQRQCQLLKSTINNAHSAQDDVSSLLDDSDQLLTDMLHANTFMLASINRFMDYAKVSDGIKLVAKLESFDIEASIQGTLHCLSSHKQSITVSPLPKNVSSRIITDKQWFQDNILCLLSNAIKFTPQGEIVLRISLQEIPQAQPVVVEGSEEEAVNIEQKMLRVEVEDNGIGISSDLQKKLFAPFQQAQQHAGGTGLGLYSLSQRVKALQGQYGVQDRRDGKQGCIFWFSFPYVPDSMTTMKHNGQQSRETNNNFTSLFTSSIDQEESNSVVTIPTPILHSRPQAITFLDQTEKNTFRRRVLLVDDSTVLRNVVSKTLETAGYQVIAVSNGFEALQLIKQDHQTNDSSLFDVVLIDLHMPVLDGFETIRRIRELEIRSSLLSIETGHTVSLKTVVPHLYIIGYSANDDEHTKKEVLSAGADGFLSKPFSIEKFESLYCT